MSSTSEEPNGEGQSGCVKSFGLMCEKQAAATGSALSTLCHSDLSVYASVFVTVTFRFEKVAESDQWLIEIAAANRAIAYTYRIQYLSEKDLWWLASPDLYVEASPASQSL